MRYFYSIFSILFILIFHPVHVGAAYVDNASVKEFIQKLVHVSRQVKKLQDLSPVQMLIGESLTEWFRQGVCFVPQEKIFTRENLKGWYSEGIGTQDAEVLMTEIFSALKESTVLFLKSKSFNPYDPGACEKDKKWYGKWIVYPGDYLVEKENLCETHKPKAALTLLFFGREENYFFGLIKEKGHWFLIYVGIDEDCNV